MIATSQQPFAPEDIEDRTYCFALRIVKLCLSIERIPGARRTIANQLLRLGTSVGANIEEARAASSRADFGSKMSISLREARETRYWIRLLMDAELIDRKLLEPLLQEATEIMKICGSITSKVRKRNA